LRKALSEAASVWLAVGQFVESTLGFTSVTISDGTSALARDEKLSVPYTGVAAPGKVTAIAATPFICA
jgi:hypothetical protein